MNGIEKITAKILQDAQQEVERMERETDEKVAEIAAQARRQAEKESGEILARGKKAADERLERLSSASQMEKRKLELAARQEVVGEAFDLALEKLCSMADKELIALLSAMAVEASATGREELIFSVPDRARIGKQVVMAANEALPQGGMLTLSQQTRPIKGGFILLDKDIETNCTFETLVRMQRESLERAVAGVLFD